MMGKNKVRLRYQQMRFLILKQEYTVRRKQQDGDDMARTVGIGLQDFEKIRRERIFLVDKTMFIKEWWEDPVQNSGKRGRPYVQTITDWN